MANPHKGEAEVKAKGRTLTLVFDLDAFAVLESDELGDRRVSEVLAEMAGPPAPGTVKPTFRQPKVATQVALLFAGARRHHPELTLEECRALMLDGDTNPVIIWPMLRALAAALGKADDDGEEGGDGADQGPPNAAGISSDS